MGWLDPKCATCGCDIKGVAEEGAVVSKRTGRSYRNSIEFDDSGERLSDISILCKKCAPEELRRSLDEIHAEREEQLAEREEQLKKNQQLFDSIIITTTSTIENSIITKYIGVVTAQVYIGVNIFRDIFSSVRDVVGGRSKSMENELTRAKNLLIREIKEEAVKINADAVVGLKIDFEDVSKSGNAFMLLGTGTAVVLEPKKISTQYSLPT